MEHKRIEELLHTGSYNIGSCSTGSLGKITHLREPYSYKYFHLTDPWGNTLEIAKY